MESTAPYTAYNRNNSYLWGFAGVFNAILLLITLGAFNSDKEMSIMPFLILGVFWLCGLSFAAWAFSQPTVRIIARHRTLDLLLRWPHRREQKRFLLEGLPVVEVQEDTDSDGDPYFICAMDLEGVSYRIFEGHNRAECEQARQKVLAALA